MLFYTVCVRCGRRFGKSKKRRLRRHLCFDCLAFEMMRSVTDGYPYPRQVVIDFQWGPDEEKERH
jgi:hypothetical protein